MEPVHPGRIEVVDGETGEVVKAMEASSLPYSMCFEDTRQGPVPIVKVVLMDDGDTRRLLHYGPDDQLLRSTTMIAD